MKIYKKLSFNTPLNYKKINLVPCTQSIMANKLLSTNLERFEDGLTLRLRVNSAKYIAR